MAAGFGSAVTVLTWLATRHSPLRRALTELPKAKAVSAILLKVTMVADAEMLEQKPSVEEDKINVFSLQSTVWRWLK